MTIVEAIEELKKEFLDVTEKITYAKDGGGFAIDIHSDVQERSKELRKMLPMKYKKFRVHILFHDPDINKWWGKD